MAVKKSDRYFLSVASSSFEELNYVPLDGEILNIAVAYGEAGDTPDTLVSLCWDVGGDDEKILFFTHSSGRDDLVDFSVTGDGTKKLTMRLDNNQETSDLLGIGWRA
jgi:hypothetical protein